MAWSDPGDFTSGQILTAAQMDSIREAMFFGQGTFTNEAARDTAYNAAGAMSPITLQEGMRAYLTASTVATATGNVTAIPSGITTVYNGSSWVCTTPVAALSNVTGTVATSASFASTLTGDGTAISATLTTGTTALVSFTTRAANSTAGTVVNAVSVSGATTITAATSTIAALFATANPAFQFMLTYHAVVTGLTAGTNTFTLNYRTDAGTLTQYSRALSVQGIA